MSNQVANCLRLKLKSIRKLYVNLKPRTPVKFIACVCVCVCEVNRTKVFLIVWISSVFIFLFKFLSFTKRDHSFIQFILYSKVNHPS